MSSSTFCVPAPRATSCAKFYDMNRFSEKSIGNNSYVRHLYVCPSQRLIQHEEELSVT
jgi:hypothetical protein